MKQQHKADVAIAQIKADRDKGVALYALLTKTAPWWAIAVAVAFNRIDL